MPHVPVRRTVSVRRTVAAVSLVLFASASSFAIAESAQAQNAAGFACPKSAASAGVQQKGPASGKLTIATTVAPITSITANIVGDLASVQGIVPEGTNSHTFEPKPSVAKLLATADIVFVNGLKLEEPTKTLAAKNMRKTAQLVELGTLALPPKDYIYDFSFPREGGKPNPHLWTNPPMAKCYAATIASVVAKADPKNANAYRANATRYTKKIDELDRLVREATRTVPAKNRRLLTYHDAYAYFAKEYGWEVVGAIQPSDFEEPTAKEVAQLIEQIKKQKVPAIFGSEVFPSPILAQIAKESGAKYIDKLRDDDLPGAPGDGEHSFLGLMRFDYVTIVDALGGTSVKLRDWNASDVVKDSARYPQ